MSLFGKNSSINKDFYSRLLWSLKYEVEYMPWHPQFIHRGSLCHCFSCCEYFFRNINWHILSVFFPLVFGISLVNWYKECLNEEIFFQRTGMPFLFFFICVIYLLYDSWALFKTESCTLCFEFLTNLRNA